MSTGFKQPVLAGATLLGRVWRKGVGPSVVAIRSGEVVDITAKGRATVSEVLALADPVREVWEAEGERLEGELHWLAPCDLQAVKACGVTFARSMIERVIEERAGGDPTRAEAIRAKVGIVIGESLRALVPGSAEAAKVKRVLIAEGLWSQYLEVGIGPDAEVFTKCPPMAAVGNGAEIGLHPISRWNNPEPEVVLAVAPDGRILGATLGNDVNLRDVEGRSALLLGKAKDNNASAAIGPWIRLFDDSFSLDDVRQMEVSLRIDGEDGFVLDGRSNMAEISRDPADLVAQAMGRHHQYPDGMMLYLGTMFSPSQDRDTSGHGFTHHLGDLVTISTPTLGVLRNVVRLATEATEWSFGTGALMKNLAGRGLI
jgi:fumarylacetoacetate (FAA) hydrolase family protein